MFETSSPGAFLDLPKGEVRDIAMTSEALANHAGRERHRPNLSAAIPGSARYDTQRLALS